MKNSGRISAFSPAKQNEGLEKIKSSLSDQKAQIVQDFSLCVDEIKRLFENKLNELMSSFHQHLFNVQASILLIQKNQAIIPRIGETLERILKDFESITSALEPKKPPNPIKPKKHRYLSVDYDADAVSKDALPHLGNGHTPGIFISPQKSHTPGIFINPPNNVQKPSSEGTNQTVRPKPEVHANFIIQESTFINTPTMLPPPRSFEQNPVFCSPDLPKSIEKFESGASGEIGKINDNLDDLKRKSSIFSYEEMKQRPRSTTKNTRPETFVKMYLTELYARMKELYNIMDLEKKVHEKNR